MLLCICCVCIGRGCIWISLYRYSCAVCFRWLLFMVVWLLVCFWYLTVSPIFHGNLSVGTIWGLGLKLCSFREDLLLLLPSTWGYVSPSPFYTLSLLVGFLDQSSVWIRIAELQEVQSVVTESHCGFFPSYSCIKIYVVKSCYWIVKSKLVIIRFWQIPLGKKANFSRYTYIPGFPLSVTFWPSEI